MRRMILAAILVFLASPAYAGQGWYLMAPPTKMNARLEVDIDAPLRKWEQRAAFDSADACERNLDMWRARATSGYQQVASPQNRYLMEFANFALCIASDDPRLK